MAWPDVVPEVKKNEHNSTNTDSQQSKDLLEDKRTAGTIKIPLMEIVNLADLWKQKTKRSGWSKRSSNQITGAWATTTFSMYDKSLREFQEHCSWCGYSSIVTPVLAITYVFWQIDVTDQNQPFTL